jgi:manganese/zinc/iron transport system permease protein
MDFWELTVRFFSLADANVRWVVAGAMLLGGAAGGLGAFAFLQRRSLLGDTLAHAALPGVGLAFLLAGRKEFIVLLLGAAVTGWLGALLINAIIRHTRIKLDSALGIVLTVFFGLGIVILTAIQKTGSGAQAGLDKFLFGQAAAMGKDDIIILAVAGITMLLVTAIGFSRFKLITFDPAFAAASGLKVGWLRFLLTTMIVFAVVIGLQAVGVVLMAAMLITPAATARQWTDRLGLMIVLASVFGIVSGILGAYVSFLAPRFPTGPWMVVAVSFLFLISVLFAPRRGVVSHIRTHIAARHKMTLDHVLKALFKAGQERKDWRTFYPVSRIAQMWSFTPKELRHGLARLRRRGLIEREGHLYRLTEHGVHEGARITRLHRLWEVYLTRFLELPHDHVHRDAEDMEHVLTPEIERRLEQILERPEHDPHDQEIPYLGREEAP